MGREIRKVPKNNWPIRDYCPHVPKCERCFQPKYNSYYLEACKKWYKEAFKFYLKHSEKFYHEEEGPPPDEKYYLSYTKEEATYYQLFETVSEGTPVTPAFSTKEELADYLAENGDFWDQESRKRGLMPCEPWGKEKAYSFIFGDGYAPSMVFTQETGLIDGVSYMTNENKKVGDKNESKN